MHLRARAPTGNEGRSRYHVRPPAPLPRLPPPSRAQSPPRAAGDTDGVLGPERGRLTGTWVVVRL